MSEQSKTTEAKHTPGPWSWSDDGYGEGCQPEEPGKRWLSIHNSNDDEVAVIVNRLRPPTDDQIADARLIAAAPELLESLTNLVAWLEASDMHRTPSGGSGPLRFQGTEYEQVTDARAAIAKAQENDR